MSEDTTSSQNKRVLAHLSAGQPIDPLAAISLFGIYRLGARIYDLRRKGYDISRETVAVRNRYGKTSRIARYSLVQGVL